MLIENYQTGAFCYWADRTKSPETIRRTRPTVVELMHIRDNSVKNYTTPPKNVVYVAVNTVNNKLYVGATRIGVEGRKRVHLANARKGGKGYFYTAIRKHGAENFEFLTFGVCRDFMHCLDVERSLIAAIKPEYNLTLGGGGSFGYVWSNESKAKVSRSKKGCSSPRKGVTLEDSSKAKISAAATSWWEDKRNSSEYKDYCGVHYARSLGIANARKAKAVRCIDTGEIFSCVRTAAERYDTRANKIAYICQHPNYKPYKPNGLPKFEYV